MKYLTEKDFLELSEEQQREAIIELENENKQLKKIYNTLLERKLDEKMTENKKKTKEYNKQYYEKNKERLKERIMGKSECPECGKSISKANLNLLLNFVKNLNRKNDYENIKKVYMKLFLTISMIMTKIKFLLMKN